MGQVYQKCIYYKYFYLVSVAEAVVIYKLLRYKQQRISKAIITGIGGQHIMLGVSTCAFAVAPAYL